MKRLGAISLATIISLGGGLIVGVATSVVWVESTISQAIAPVQAQTNQNSDAIANINTNLEGVNTKLDFILGKYGVQYNEISGRVTNNTSTR